jgi:hypothetical protein
MPDVDAPAGKGDEPIPLDDETGAGDSGAASSGDRPDSAGRPAAPPVDVLARVNAILAAFHGKTTAITDAGRENMRTVNRLSRLVPLRHVATDRAFRHNISRYHSDALEQDILIGARREGNGVWSLVAELTPRKP